ncbi:protein TASOR 2 isoform 2-T2 [Leptodactylus fuscus]|uniref:protein TASOR 2 isoform X2 n=1 Tax=Leptodactylus fuscus TaxID=238119 RepID=UPI003F4E4B9E
MLVLADSDMIHSNNSAPYNVWKGQLYIHEQLVCHIILQAESACSIPAQLSEKLDLKEVIQLSELRKKLPEDIFQKTDFTGQEVSCGNIYYSLNSVIPSTIIGSKLDNLLKFLKDHDLALIKGLNDRGFLILLNGAVLQSNTGINDGNSAQLYALFLFPHQKFFEQREKDVWENKLIRKELPSTVGNLLPGLHYAISESNKLQKEKALYPSPLVEQYFRKYSLLQSKKDDSLERKEIEPLALPNSHGDDLPKKCSQLAFSCLQLYFSSPVNFSIPLIKMSNILAENSLLSGNSDQCGKTVGSPKKMDSLSSPSRRSMAAESKAGSDKLPGKQTVRENKEQHKRSTKRKSSKKRETKSRSKSTHRAALSTTETVDNRASNKRRRLVPEEEKQIVSSSEATVKLASPPYPQRRKRGAEVLTAAFIHDEKRQTTEKIASNKTNEENKDMTPKTKAITRKPRKVLAPEKHVPDRPPKRKASNPGNKNLSVGATNKSESVKRTNEGKGAKAGRGAKKSPEKTTAITVDENITLSKSSENSAPISEDSMIEKRINMYESHALNLLADLALNSFGSTNIPYISRNVASANEPLVEEAASTGDSVSTVEHPPMDCSLPVESTTAVTEPERILETESDKPKNGLNVSPRNIALQKRLENSEKPLSPKAHIAAAKAKARYNALSKICLEHSYSQLPIEDISGKSSKHVQVHEQPSQNVPDSTTPADLLPEPSSGLPGEVALLTNENVCPEVTRKKRAVSKRRDNFVITFDCEPNYDFELDSKFTKDPLEKTINRALHGPWNYHLKEKVEDVKIILHMWIALFYSRSNKQITCSSRKVVEHSNPAKYVSINTVLDPFELEITDSDGFLSAENDHLFLPVGKKSGILRHAKPLESNVSGKSGRSESKRLPDFVPTKVKPKDIEHKYSRSFSSIYEAKLRAGSRRDCKKVTNNIEEKEGNVSVYEHVSSAGRASETQSDTITAKITPDSHETTSTVVLTERRRKFLCNERYTIYSPEMLSTGDLDKDTTNENLTSLKFPSENHDTSKDLGKEDAFAVHSLSEVPASVNSPKTVAQTSESLDLPEAAVLLSQELNDRSAIADQAVTAADVALQSTEGSDIQLAITNKFRAMVIESPSHHSDVNTEFCINNSSNMVETEKCDKDSSGMDHVAADKLPAAESLHTNVHSKPVQSEDIKQVGGQADNIASPLEPQKKQIVGQEVWNNMESRIRVDYNSNCTIEGETDSTGCENTEGKVLESIPDDSGDLAEATNKHVDENEITDTTLSRPDLSNTSDKGSIVESIAESSSTALIKACEQESNNISLHESSEKSEGKEEHIIGEDEISPSVEHVIPGICTEKIHIVQETDVDEPDHISEASMVDEVEKDVPEMPFFRLHVASSCSSEDDDDANADLLNAAATDEGTKESGPSNYDVNLSSGNVEGSCLVATEKEVPSTENKAATDHAEDFHNGVVCLVDEPAEAGADSGELDQVAITSVSEGLDREAMAGRYTMEVATQSEKHEGHVHKDEVPESQNQLPISQTPFEEEKTNSNTSSVKTVNEEDDSSGLAVKEMQTDMSEFQLLLLKHQTNNVESSALTNNTLDGKSDVSDPNEKSLQLNITSSFSDQSIVEMGSEQNPVEKQQPDVPEDDVYVCSDVIPTKISAKDPPPSSRSSSSNKKEILSKLKRIFSGSMTGQQVTSTSENVMSPGLNITSGSVLQETGEVFDVEKNALPHDENNASENCIVVTEEPAIHDSSPEESSITIVNQVENDEGEMMPPQDNCLISPSLEDVSDSIEQDPSPELPDICFIVNTGSISKEQYDRWSETSDEDIEYISSYKEPEPHQEHFPKEISESHGKFLDKAKCSQEQTTSDEAKKSYKRQSNNGVSETNEHFSRQLPDLEYNNNTTKEPNVSATRNIKGPARATRTVNKESSSNSDLDHLFSNRRMVSDDLTQNTLDMENVRFMCRLKEILRKSSTDKHIYGPPFQTMFESKKIPSCSRTATKNISPLLITMHCPYRRTDFRRHDSLHPGIYNSSPYYEDELLDRPVAHSRTIRKFRSSRYSPFHFNRLRYENTLDKSNNDISVILNECVQSNHLKLNSVGLGSSAIDRTSASQQAEESGRQARRACVPTSSKSQSVKNMISDLCVKLHSKLQNVAKVSEHKIYFYIYESEDDNFISTTKSLLVREGHIPTDPLDFLNSDHSESDQLLVVIKNEDVFTCVNKIPYLLQLKLLPNVSFSGVDTPEDIMESTYEELFQAGGFVASDKSLLENITLGKLKEVLATLEKMNRSSPWKWLVHYRENRKLKEDKRAEALSRTKLSLLKTYQQSNVVEILPYHQCDLRSKEPLDDLSCLLNLQYQHIHSRLAVYLTGTTCLATEGYEQNGILVYDVDTFLRKIQKVDSQFQASYWS